MPGALAIEEVIRTGIRKPPDESLTSVCFGSALPTLASSSRSSASSWLLSIGAGCRQANELGFAIYEALLEVTVGFQKVLKCHA